MILQHFLARYEGLSLRSRKGFPLLHPDDALQCIIEGCLRGFSFEGLDGFFLLSEGRIQPEQNLSVDRFDYADVSVFTAIVVKLLLDNRDALDLVFEIVFSEP